MYHLFQISSDVLKTLGLKMKFMITFIFTSVLIGSIFLLSPPNNFNDQLLYATINGSKESKTPQDKLLGGLLTSDFDERSCVSRYYKSSLYRKPSPYKPSEYLISKLRSYEKLHKRCGPGTQAYKEATKNLIGHNDKNYANKTVGECKYIVWVAVYGLGNRILTLASVFLYALLTERVVLVDQSKDISDLFCEPFPGTSWLLPRDFPLTRQIDGYNKGYSRCYGTMLNNHAITANSTPPHLYLHILHDSRDEDKMFFCPKDQTLIDKVPCSYIHSGHFKLMDTTPPSVAQLLLSSIINYNESEMKLNLRKRVRDLPLNPTQSHPSSSNTEELHGSRLSSVSSPPLLISGSPLSSLETLAEK
ncbi:hypothetical protein Bca52824_079074 [Brassica carinata]|uniref:Fucosyltransferase n=1 Tax=Brassica carinata TaxID=52824 RepID=A0A8X7PZ74_BRACI|nr:hypothetical protein Bca52824_079074 [Brassica carinata]